MPYEIGFLIPSNIVHIKNWKEILEKEIKTIDGIIEELDLPNIYSNSIEATKAAQLIKEYLGATRIITVVSVEPITEI